MNLVATGVFGNLVYLFPSLSSIFTFEHTAVRKLPPLEAASALFYELTGAGFLILTVAIGTGMVFVDDLFGQHLVHKTVLTMLAWCLYAVLLFQYFRRGWRVQSAISLSTIAFGLVVLGFFGSKLVLELLLPLTQ